MLTLTFGLLFKTFNCFQVRISEGYPGTVHINYNIHMNSTTPTVVLFTSFHWFEWVHNERDRRKRKSEMEQITVRECYG